MATLEYRLLGPLEVTRDGEPLPLRAALQRRLLALLLLDPNRVVSADRLIEELWDGSPPTTAANTLQVYVSHLRKLLGADAIETRPPGYVLHAEPAAIDAARAETLVAEGRERLAADDPLGASTRFREALALWRGEPLAELDLAAAAQAELLRLDELRLSALEERLEADLQLGRHAELVPELEALAAANPLRERLRAQLMLALYRSGRQADALGVFAAVRERLVDDLGIEPGPLLQRLQRSILVQSVELDPPPAREPSGDEPRERRKTVTAVYASVELVQIGEPLDPEAREPLVRRALDRARGALERHGGTVETLPGRTLLALFGVPAVHEDDALRAARAVLDVRRALGEAQGPRGVRTELAAALATGPALVRESPTSSALVAGEPIDAAQELHRRATAGTILLAASAAAALGDAAELDGERLVALRQGAAAIPRRLDRPLVGREHELEQLRVAFAEAVAARAPRLVSVVGPPGVGKSRLAHALTRELSGSALVLVTACPPYGAEQLGPLRDLVVQAVGEDVEAGVSALLEGEGDADAVASRLAAVLGVAGATGGGEDVGWALSRLLQTLAQLQPLLVVLDDLQWGDPAFLDLVEETLGRLRGAPLLVLGVARPELLAERQAFAADALSLAALSSTEGDTLLAQLATQAWLPPEVCERIVAVSEGNPLFIEQMHAHAAETGAVDLPPSLHALLQARLDLLPTPERRVLDIAAVIAPQSAADDIAELLPPDERGGATLRLEALVRRELLTREADGRYAFRHQLIREEAYASIAKRERATLHEAVANRPDAPDEVAGTHLERAWRCRVDVDPDDVAAPALAQRAAEQLARAGADAFGRGEMRAGAALLARAVALPGAQDAAACARLVDLGDALREFGAFGESRETLERALALADALDERKLASRARVIRLRLQMQAELDAGIVELTDVANAEIREIEALGDDAALAEVWNVLGWLRWMRGRAAESEEAILHAIDHARRADAPVSLRRALSLYVGIGIFGPMHVRDAIARCESTRAVAPTRATEASCLRAIGYLRGMEADYAAARELLARDREILDELGLRVARGTTCEQWANLALWEGDLEQAERELRHGYEVLDAFGEKAGLSTVVALLGEVLYRQERLDEALEACDAAAAMTLPDDMTSQVMWRGPYAKVLAHQGQAERALALAREGVELAGRTDFAGLRGGALLDLASVLDLTGDAVAGLDAARGAADVFRAKGNVSELRRAEAAAARFVSLADQTR